ncbi:hypothetical protein Q1695_011026 [Nippostrongylus brasiliensis]|nr:hypothetical protein Q1695_011026 [Nippostrongylus brasiliensis]
MDAVASLVSKYREDLEEAAQDLRRRTEELSQSAPKYIEDTKNSIEPTRKEIVDAIQDQSNVNPAVKPTIEVFAWATVTVFFANVGIFLGVNILGGLVGMCCGRFGAAMVAFVGIPFYAHYKIKQGGSDKTKRMEILSYAILQGVVTGFVIDSIYLSYIPYAIITPAVIAASFGVVVKSANGNRSTILGGTIGTAIGVNFLLGMVTGSMSFVYLLLTLTYAGVAFIIMQLMFKNSKDSNVYQNALSCGIIVAKGMFFLMFGSYTPDDQDDRK